jgi:hypothetical protein
MILSIIPKNKKKFHLAGLVFAVESAVLILGLLWMLLRKIPVVEKIHVTPFALVLGAGAGVAVLASSFLFHLIDKFFFRLALTKLMEEKVYPIFQGATMPEILFIAAMSGFCEEFFFRGILFPEAGIVVSSLVFGLLHTSSPKTWFTGLWTALIGAFFALTYALTGNLFVPMAAHALNNFAAVCYVRYFHFREEESPSPPQAVKEEMPAAPAPQAPGMDIKEEAMHIAREKVKENLETAKKGLGDIAREAGELVRELKEEFLPGQAAGEPAGEEAPPMAASPVQLLDPAMGAGAMKSASRIGIPEPDYEPMGLMEEDGPMKEEKDGKKDAFSREIGAILKGALSGDKGKKRGKSTPAAGPGAGIDPGRRASDIDHEGIGIVNDPQ